MTQAPPVDVFRIVPKADAGAAFAQLAMNQMAGGLTGSRILYEEYFEFLFLFEWLWYGEPQGNLVADYLDARDLR